MIVGTAKLFQLRQIGMKPSFGESGRSFDIYFIVKT